MEEGLEGRRPTEENIGQTAATQTQSRNIASRGLDGVREAARKDEQVRFTALLHHVTVDLLRASYYELKQQAASGVDGVTWQPYGTEVEARLGDLHGRVQRDAYRAQPSKRAYIPKADAQQRALRIATWRTRLFNRQWSRS